MAGTGVSSGPGPVAMAGTTSGVGAGTEAGAGTEFGVLAGTLGRPCLLNPVPGMGVVVVLRVVGGGAGVVVVVTERIARLAQQASNYSTQ